MDFTESFASTDRRLSKQHEVSLAESHILHCKFSPRDEHSINSIRSHGQRSERKSLAGIQQRRLYLNRNIPSPVTSLCPRDCAVRGHASRSRDSERRSSSVSRDHFEGHSRSHTYEMDEFDIESRSGRRKYVFDPLKRTASRRSSPFDSNLRAEDEVDKIVHAQQQEHHSNLFSEYDGDSEGSKDAGIAVRGSGKREGIRTSSKTSLAGQISILDDVDGQFQHSSQMIRGRGSAPDKGMKTLLIYRAVLFAVLCALAADTSCVYENELGRRVVQVL